MDFPKLESALVKSYGTSKDITDRINFEKKILHISATTTFVINLLHELHEIDFTGLKPRLIFSSDRFSTFSGDFDLDLTFLNKNDDDLKSCKKENKEFKDLNFYKIKKLKKILETTQNIDFSLFASSVINNKFVDLSSDKNKNYEILTDIFMPNELKSLARNILLESALESKETDEKRRFKL